MGIGAGIDGCEKSRSTGIFFILLFSICALSVLVSWSGLSWLLPFVLTVRHKHLCPRRDSNPQLKICSVMICSLRFVCRQSAVLRNMIFWIYRFNSHSSFEWISAPFSWAVIGGFAVCRVVVQGVIPNNHENIFAEISSKMTRYRNTRIFVMKGTRAYPHCDSSVGQAHYHLRSPT